MIPLYTLQYLITCKSLAQQYQYSSLYTALKYSSFVNKYCSLETDALVRKSFYRTFKPMILFGFSSRAEIGSWFSRMRASKSSDGLQGLMGSFIIKLNLYFSDGKNKMKKICLNRNNLQEFADWKSIQRRRRMSYRAETEY